ELVDGHRSSLPPWGQRSTNRARRRAAAVGFLDVEGIRMMQAPPPPGQYADPHTWPCFEGWIRQPRLAAAAITDSMSLCGCRGRAMNSP
ncbi:MAG: hypothetical protein QGH45_17240, partial [Myxococcota bacterium]|nr:hypothetical protein [Myxococcota bacterium]